MTKGDRLGHSWREGRLLYPGLASDFASMIRAALALHEATGEASLSRAGAGLAARIRRALRQPGQRRLFPHRGRRRGPGGAAASTSDDATPNPNGIAAQNLVRLAALTGDQQWRDKADRLFDGVLAAAADQLFQHAALLNALDLRLNAAEIVVTGPDHERFADAALKLPFSTAIVLRAPSAATLPASHPAQAKIAAAPGERGLRLRRRNLLAAGRRSARNRRRRQRDAASAPAERQRYSQM